MSVQEGEARLVRAHGVYNVVAGLWPLLHMRSFQAVMGAKTDVWLVRTVAGLLLTNGLVQLGAATPGGVRHARRLGMGTAATLATIDLAYAPRGRISRMYLLDAVLEVGWVTVWARRSALLARGRAVRA